MPYMTKEQLKGLGLKSYGENVLISTKASIYNAHLISIGSHVRIDDFCLIAGAGRTRIGSFVHLAPFASLNSGADITLEDFSGLSFKVSVFASSDDYMGYGLTNPMVAPHLRFSKNAPVTLERHALVGAHSVLLPGAHLELGVSVGACSVVSKRLKSFGVYMGNPVRYICRRSKRLLEKEAEFLAWLENEENARGLGTHGRNLRGEDK